jgi:probable F420-dependent oxidoreductase
VRIGLSAYDVHAADLLELARAADAAGFDSLWLGEHVVLPVGFATAHPTTAQPGEQHHTGPIISPRTELVDPLVNLGAAAAVTTRLRLATGVYVLPLRHPLAVARSTCTVQEIAGGRFSLGVGSGWLAEEFAALDVPFGERRSRLDEAIEVLRKAWAGGEVHHQGRHFSVSGVQVTQRRTDIPVVLGGNTDRALRRAATLGDGWFSSGTPSFDESRRLRDELQRMRRHADAELGLDRPFEVIVRVEGHDPDELRRYAAAGFDEVLIWADQVWPPDEPMADRRDRVFAAAEAFGLSPRAVA